MEIKGRSLVQPRAILITVVSDMHDRYIYIYIYTPDRLRIRKVPGWPTTGIACHPPSCEPPPTLGLHHSPPPVRLPLCNSSSCLPNSHDPWSPPYITLPPTGSRPALPLRREHHGGPHHESQHFLVRRRRHTYSGLCSRRQRSQRHGSISYSRTTRMRRPAQASNQIGMYYRVSPRPLRSFGG